MKNKKYTLVSDHFRDIEITSDNWEDADDWTPRIEVRENPNRSLSSLYTPRCIFLGAVTLAVIFYFMVHATSELSNSFKKEIEDVDFSIDSETFSKMPDLSHTTMRSLGARLNCDPGLIAPSAMIPTNVNAVRPADIHVIGALGDSITVASFSKNYNDDERNIFVGNSFFIGGDEDILQLATLGNILKHVNPKLVGLSHGKGESERGFNVAVGGMTCEDLPRQAAELVDKIKNNPDVVLEHDWKLITIFIGTNDIGNLSCYKDRPYIPYTTYKDNLEQTIGILQNGLPRTIVSILAIWNGQLTIESNSLIHDGKRKSCGEGSIQQRDDVLDSYRKAAYELQNEKKFNTNTFTVVTQSFLDEIKDAFRNKRTGEYDTVFYADDVFHLSKYGNGIMGKNLWNNLLQPVGNKTTKAVLNDDFIPLLCPDKDAPFIRTLGNS